MADGCILLFNQSLRQWNDSLSSNVLAIELWYHAHGNQSCQLLADALFLPYILTYMCISQNIYTYIHTYTRT